MKTSVSFLGSPYPFPKIIDRISDSTANFIHVDVADGLFVNNKTPFTSEMLKILKKSKKPKEVHLMTLHLKTFIDVFSLINPESIVYQFEATANHDKIIKYIKSKNTKVGIAIGPLTPIENLIPYLKKIDLVLVLSVIPGYGGQKFITETVSRIEKLQNLKKERKANFSISVDGGINEETVKDLQNLKVDRVVAGSYVYKCGNFNEQIKKLKSTIDSQ